MAVPFGRWQKSAAPPVQALASYKLTVLIGSPCVAGELVLLGCTHFSLPALAYISYVVRFMSSLHNKRIILGITGGIAAYKSAELCRLLIKAGADVRVVMTPGAQEFITPLTLQALSGNRVHTKLLDVEVEAAMGHIELARWADLILVAPASANFIARLAHGEADDLLTTLCLARRCPLALAPAMNQAMWSNAKTQQNLAGLTEGDTESSTERDIQFSVSPFAAVTAGDSHSSAAPKAVGNSLEQDTHIRAPNRTQSIHVFGPDTGAQACGDIGAGRMMEPQQLVDQAAALFRSGALAGVNVTITAGPTREAIDPVRYISNHSSGKMGYALARAAVEAGARVTLISGPVALPVPDHVTLVPVTTALEMLSACETDPGEIFVAVAAVADYRMAEVAPQKLKKAAAELQLTLIRNPDILATIAARELRPFCVGFAAETENLSANAKAKLQHKKLDLIFANEATTTFGSDDAQALACWPGGEEWLPAASKDQLARHMIALISARKQEVENGNAHDSALSLIDARRQER